jgi:hypothetical protein
MSPKVAIPLAATLPVLLLAACLGDGNENVSASGTASVSGSVPTQLNRPLHFPEVAGARCPASRGRYVVTPDFGSMAIGAGPVRVAINNAGNPHQGFHPAAFRGWLALKTHFFSSPSYQGPFLVRAKRLDHPGLVTLGATPTEAAPLLVRAGAYAGTAGWREVPYFTFVRAPGCYGWQVDGRTFSEIIVVRLLRKFQA